jgi:hypothetical protein
MPKPCCRSSNLHCKASLREMDDGVAVVNGRTDTNPFRIRLAAITRESHYGHRKGSDRVHSVVRVVYSSNRNGQSKDATEYREQNAYDRLASIGFRGVTGFESGFRSITQAGQMVSIT